MADAPKRIWINYAAANAGYAAYDEPPRDDGDDCRTEYIRADLCPAPTPLAAALAVPKVQALVEAAELIRATFPPITGKGARWSGMVQYDGADVDALDAALAALKGGAP